MRCSIFFLAILLLAAPACAGQTAGAGLTAGAKHPLRVSPGARPVTASVRLDTVEFNQITCYGFRRLDGQPARGTPYFIEARLSAEAAVATTKFEAVGEGGEVILPLRLFRVADANGGGEYYGVMRVPDRPFRVAVSGEGVDGEGYSRVYGRLFTPTAPPPAGAPDRPGAGCPWAGDGERLEAAYRQLAADMEMNASGKYRDGVIVLPHARVSRVTYAPLLSKAGRSLGIRVSYDVEFTDDGYYNPALQAWPVYEREEWRGLVGMKVIDGRITPLPGGEGLLQVQAHILANGAGYDYRGGTTYHFTADLVPDYASWDERAARWCVDDSRFRYRPNARAAWRALLADGAPTKYRVFIENTGFGGEVEGFYSQGALHRSFVAEGAKGCRERPADRL